MGSNQYLAGRVYGLGVYFMTGAPEGSTESGFIEKPEIESATPGLQGIGLSPTKFSSVACRLSHQCLIFGPYITCI